MTTGLFVIVDYNLTRIDDVRIMMTRASKVYGLKTVLVRANPTAADQEIADHVIGLDPLDPNFVEAATMSMKRLGHPRAVLPFSDNAVASGAAVAERFGVMADDSRQAFAAYSKIAYRRAEEQRLTLQPQSEIHAPQWQEVSTIDEITTFWRDSPQGFVIKPACEGNNRGVVKVLSQKELAAAFDAIAPYLDKGAICEEIIHMPEEYSFDGVGSLRFITRKSSVSGPYPVEYGQTVPASLPETQQTLIERAGSLANQIVGQRHGPFHNEIKFDPYRNRAAVIEPNRRPGGMKIWHLAKKVFGVDLLEYWVDLALGIAPTNLSLSYRGTAAVRMLPAPFMGVLGEVDCGELLGRILKRMALSPEYLNTFEWSDFKTSVPEGSLVSDVVKDNAGFIAEITVFTPGGYGNTDHLLDLFQAAWLKEITRSITPWQNPMSTHGRARGPSRPDRTAAIMASGDR